MTSKQPRTAIISRKGLRRNLGNRAILYKCGRNNQNVEGRLFEDDSGFSVRDGEEYSVENGQRIGVYSRERKLRMYDVVLP